MIELLIVVAILGVLMVGAMIGFTGNTAKARDARRKGDLSKLKIVFEDYYNDNECYPEEDVLEDCNSDNLKPYLNKVPCDPRTKEPYVYQPESNCRGYQLFAFMERLKDQALNAGICYGIAAGVPLEPPEACEDTAIAGGPTPTPTGGGGGATPTPTPSGGGGAYACDPNGNCNVYSNPVAAGCPVTFANAGECQAACDASSANWCRQ